MALFRVLIAGTDFQPGDFIFREKELVVGANNQIINAMLDRSRCKSIVDNGVKFFFFFGVLHFPHNVHSLHIMSPSITLIFWLQPLSKKV